MWVQSLGWEDPLEEGVATHSSILAWKIPWTEEPGRLHPWGHKEPDTTERLSIHAHTYRSCWLPKSFPSSLYPQLCLPQWDSLVQTS